MLSEAGTCAPTGAERILEDWRATLPATTLSSGVATVEPDETPDAVLARRPGASRREGEWPRRAELAAAAPVAA